MKTVFSILPLLAALALACAATTPKPSATPLAQVRAVASLTGDAWVLAATACRDAAVAAESEDLLKTCAATLEPARKNLLAVDALIDAGQTPNLCALREVLDAVTAALKYDGVLKAASGTTLALVTDALSLVPVCQTDGGAE